MFKQETHLACKRDRLLFELASNIWHVCIYVCMYVRMYAAIALCECRLVHTSYPLFRVGIEEPVHHYELPIQD